LAHNNGNIWNASTIAKSLGITSPTVQKYLSFLENSFMITVLPSFHINVKKRIVKAPKIYYRDTGILHYLHKTNSLDSLQGHPVIGSSWEGYAIEQIKQFVQGKYELYFYRTHRGAECDLLLVDGTTVVYAIEIKYSSAPKVTKGYINSIEDVNAQQNFIITPNSDAYLIKEQIRVCSLSVFLKTHLK
jgi:predicted AAA+ superfamily ATPase